MSSLGTKRHGSWCRSQRNAGYESSISSGRWGVKCSHPAAAVAAARDPSTFSNDEGVGYSRNREAGVA